MNTQVYLSPTKLSILSIPRDKVWIFLSATLQLLHQSTGSSKYEEDEDYSDDETDSYGYGSTTNQYDRESSDSPIAKSTNVFLPVISNEGSSGLGRVELSTLSDTLLEQSGARDDFGDSLSNELGSEEDGCFFHIAFTPSECTVICSTTLMETLFKQPLILCQELHYTDVKLFEDTVLNLQIDSDGDVDKTERILELTKPLSENKILLFYLTSHFTDIVLVPYGLREKVISVLTGKGFKFSHVSKSFIFHKDDGAHFMSPNDNDNEDSTKSVEYSAFDSFKEAQIKPQINKSVKLLLTGARTGEVDDAIEKTAKFIAANNVPGYFAITRTALNEVSLILPKSLKKRSKLGFDFKSLIGSSQDIIIPITFDLTKLAMNATGIVAGLASKISEGVKKFPDRINFPFEMNYLSMARSGVIMVPEENIELVSEVLEGTE